jgi:hypothetical protein
MRLRDDDDGGCKRRNKFFPMDFSFFLSLLVMERAKIASMEISEEEEGGGCWWT